MFEFDPSDRVGVDDYRPAVHDSDGLAMLNGRGEQAWRQLQNPASLQHSGFQDRDPRGFGLMQRKRDYADYQDTEADYQKRPSLWVEPVGDWGEGEVHLVEIPTDDEYHDNIVAFWRPKQALAAGQEHRWRYRLHWCRDHAWQPGLATVAGTRIGKAAKGARLVVIDLAGGRLSKLADDAKPRVDAGRVAWHAAQPGRVPQRGHRQLAHELRTRTGRCARGRVARAPGRCAGPAVGNLAVPVDGVSVDVEYRAGAGARSDAAARIAAGDAGADACARARCTGAGSRPRPAACSGDARR